MTMIDILRTGVVRTVARAVLPVSVRSFAKRFMSWPRVGKVEFGNLRRITPISTAFGFDRGLPIDRYYIENFLARHRDDVHGRVLEIGGSMYTRKYGGERVTKSDILHVSSDHPEATIVADLTRADFIPSDTFDCIIFTQTIQCIYDAGAALKTLQRILKPGGTLLATTTGIGQLSPSDMDRWGEWWRFTTLSVRRLFGEAFPSDSVEVQAHGNVLAAVAFLHGLAVAELTQRELDYHDPAYQMVITARVVKPAVQ